MPTSRLLLPIAVLFFIAGLLSVLVFEPPGDSVNSSSGAAGDPALQPTLPPLQPDQITLLVLGVDSLESANPKLMAVWLVEIRTREQAIRLVGLPIDAAASQTGGASLVDLFGWDPDQGPSADFLSAFQMISQFQPDVTLALDEQGFATLIDFLGGVWIEGAYLDGNTSVSTLGFIDDDPQLSLQLQASLLNALRSELDSLEESPEITQLTSLLPHHAYTSHAPSSLVNLYSLMLPLKSELIQIELWSQNVQ